MKTATLITGLIKQEVAIGDYAKYRWYDLTPLTPLVSSDGKMLMPSEAVTVHEDIVPITRFCEKGKRDIYIAYSKEVEEFLSMPFSILRRDLDIARKNNEYLKRNLYELTHMGLWGKIKFLFCMTRQREPLP